jgi:hypothetical protein
MIGSTVSSNPRVEFMSNLTQPTLQKSYDSDEYLWLEETIKPLSLFGRGVWGEGPKNRYNWYPED